LLDSLLQEIVINANQRRVKGFFQAFPVLDIPPL